MLYLEQSLDSPAENLALDEALLEEAEAVRQPREALRIWEPKQVFVVVGRASRVQDEVNVDTCRRRGIPILRRSSGGAAIVTGPGCLMYSVVLSYQLRPVLRSVAEAHRFVLDNMAQALRQLAPTVHTDGTSDLTVENEYKFSGNSVRCKRDHLLYHGTILFDFPLALIDQYLRMPPRQPTYRRHRTHGRFVKNLNASREQIQAALVGRWRPLVNTDNWLPGRTRKLVETRYHRPEWNYRH